MIEETKTPPEEWERIATAFECLDKEGKRFVVGVAQLLAETDCTDALYQRPDAVHAKKYTTATEHRNAIAAAILGGAE